MKRIPANQISIFDVLPGDKPVPERVFEGFHKDDKVLVIDGEYKNRTGTYFKKCSAVFPDHCRVWLDLQGREKEKKYIMILKSNIKVIA